MRDRLKVYYVMTSNSCNFHNAVIV